MGCRQAVRHGTLTPASVGSNPAIPDKEKQALCLLFFISDRSVQEPMQGARSQTPSPLLIAPCRRMRAEGESRLFDIRPHIIKKSRLYACFTLIGLVASIAIKVRKQSGAFNPPMSTWQKISVHYLLSF